MPPPSSPSSLHPGPLRILASGTLFYTYTLSLPSHPSPGSNSNVRAHSYIRSRNGSACSVLAVLSQFQPGIANEGPTGGAGMGGGGVEGCWLIASLGGNDEGKEVLRELDRAGISTKYCKIWDGVGVPGAWVLHADNTDTQTVINHNPLPDITHEEFVSLLGPILAPENYPPPPPLPIPLPSPPAPLHSPSNSPLNSPNPNGQYQHPGYQYQNRPPGFNRILLQYGPRVRPTSPAPFDWLHFEGRSVRTTLTNMMGIDGLARERKWRRYCVFSVDVGRRARAGVEALIPHADVIFFNKHYALSHSSTSTSSAPITPRSFLLSLTSLAPPHALLIAHWGSEGAAILSVPTKEYLQSSAWEPALPAASSPSYFGHTSEDLMDVRSVRSGSDFFAAPGERSEESWRASGTSVSIFSALLGSEGAHSALKSSEGGHELGYGHYGQDDIMRYRERETETERGRRRDGKRKEQGDEDGDEDGNGSDDSQGTEIANDVSGPLLDEVGAQDAFVAGMIYALSRRLLPGGPYSPGLASMGDEGSNWPGEEKARWRLDECLRFATELSGRKARKRGWDGLADEMRRAGWFLDG
ncbi:uncharacterized protein STEHIDRAFT_105022 [Stereum hirsutum FP-91666 SS1]|uniref:uncharacterized protein n=1 Tax=Stereum hirsutum (strain FP-91666) TaxID=721885 RepID=UPI000444983E|nr:uncharacterized protein STEHIDRAFT_105022 [Stereum hirsutum FP-91666 SS1]EIM80680.1 hypothetical protein STEHIDRAFT_105022 [Stereum hirsutum FP-91666 SS1]